MSEQTRNETATRLDALTGLRFVAALLVVLHHFGNDLIGGAGAGFTYVGYEGVTFFFVLSGFVLTWSYRPGSTRGSFYRRRVARVYPLHVVTWVIALVLLAAADVPATVKGDAASLVLLQAWGPTDVALAGNGVSWSLSCEAFFYAIFPFVIAWVLGRRFETARLWLYVAAGLFTLVFVALLVKGSGGFTLLYLNPLGRVIDFLLGIAIAFAVKNGHRAPIRLPVALGVTAVAYLAFGITCATAGIPDWLIDRFPADAVFLPLFVLVVWAAATDQQTSAAGRELARPWLVRLGVWSFALYLTHTLVIQVVDLATDPLTWNLAGRLGAAAALLLVCIAVSAAAYRFVEAPLERRISGRVSTIAPNARVSAQR